jgi:hypothetical protein
MKARKLRAQNTEECKQAGKTLFNRRNTEMLTNGGE